MSQQILQNLTPYQKIRTQINDNFSELYKNMNTGGNESSLNMQVIYQDNKTVEEFEKLYNCILNKIPFVLTNGTKENNITPDLFKFETPLKAITVTTDTILVWYISVNYAFNGGNDIASIALGCNRWEKVGSVVTVTNTTKWLSFTE